MSNSLKFIQRLFLWLLITGTHAAYAQTNSYLKSAKASIQGTSSLHDWESDITKIEYKGYYLTAGNAIKTIKNIEVKILVKDIKSSEGKIMDNKTFEAFKSDKNPYIIFTFNSNKVRMDAMKIVTVEASGNLTMAGTTRPIVLVAKGKVLPNGDFSFYFSKKIKMTEYNMVPPAAVLGTIKVGNEVTVTFDLVLSQHKLPL